MDEFAGRLFAELDFCTQPCPRLFLTPTILPHIILQISQPLVPLVDEFAGRLFAELDYCAEGHNCERFAKLYADVPRVSGWEGDEAGRGLGKGDRGQGQGQGGGLSADMPKVRGGEKKGAGARGQGRQGGDSRGLTLQQP